MIEGARLEIQKVVKDLNTLFQKSAKSVFITKVLEVNNMQDWKIL